MKRMLLPLVLLGIVGGLLWFYAAGSQPTKAGMIKRTTVGCLKITDLEPLGSAKDEAELYSRITERLKDGRCRLFEEGTKIVTVYAAGNPSSTSEDNKQMIAIGIVEGEGVDFKPPLYVVFNSAFQASTSE